jgi:hypothetical protein
MISGLARRNADRGDVRHRVGAKSNPTGGVVHPLLGGEIGGSPPQGVNNSGYAIRQGRQNSWRPARLRASQNYNAVRPSPCPATASSGLRPSLPKWRADIPVRSQDRAVAARWSARWRTGGSRIAAGWKARAPSGFLRGYGFQTGSYVAPDNAVRPHCGNTRRFVPSPVWASCRRSK